MASQPSTARKLIFAILGLVVTLAIGYFGYFFYLKQYAQASYQRLNCAESIKSSGQLLKFFPAGMSQGVIDTALLNECKSFEAAASRFSQSNWEAAYNGYQQYLAEYPSGHFAGTAQRESQAALYESAKGLSAAGDYAAAIQKLDTLLNGDQALVIEGDPEQARVEAYLGWIKQLRASADFEAVTAKVAQVKALGLSAYPDLERDIQNELVGTTLDWALASLAEKQFEAAEKKLAEAIRLDPSPDMPSSVSQQAKKSQADLFIQWGDALLADQKFDQALDRYRKVASVTGTQDASAQSAIARVYIAWAKTDAKKEDFKAALERLKRSVQNDKIDDAKSLIEAATQEMYLAFSQSSGTQASQAMIDAANDICKGRAVEFPIFSLNPDKKLVYLEAGNDDSLKEPLPDDLKATTPGEMHFVACVVTRLDVVVKENTLGYIGSMRVPAISTLQTPNWDITLRRADTGEVVAEGSLAGTPPGPDDAPSGQVVFNYGGSVQVKLLFIGGYPTYTDLVAWINKSIQ